jgi:hypothetical protein
MKRQKRSITILMTLMAFLVLPAIIQAGQLTPSAPPAPTMKSLDEIYQKLSDIQQQQATMNNDIRIIKGNLGIGSRFLDNSNGTVTDSKTGLVWLKNANPCGTKNWNDAVAYCASLANGQAGLTDGSVAGQWRLPTKQELEGIGTNPPVTWDEGLPTVTWTTPGTPFTSVQSNWYWSNTEYTDMTYAWGVRMLNGGANYRYKSLDNNNVWPVRNP